MKWASFWDYIRLFSLAGLVIVLDQSTKILLRNRIPFGGTWSPWSWSQPFFQIVNTHNAGAAFSLGQGFGSLLGVVAIAISLAIVYFYPRVPSNDIASRIALGLILGGALGNLIDRILYGQVTDFISISYFAVVNVADIFITTGTCILLISSFVMEIRERKKPHDDSFKRDDFERQ